MSVNNPKKMPISVHPRKLAFTAAHLRQLNTPDAYLLPLAVVGFVDMNCFYCQCERNRLRLSDDAPIVCSQWGALIAVSYAARKFGVNRHTNLAAAKQLCPDLVPVSPAVFKKGDSHWFYTKHIPPRANYKISLDPYRRESRKILRLLLLHCDVVEKASVDEAFLDLGRLIYKKIIEEFPQLQDCEGDLPPVPEDIDRAWYGEVTRTPAELADQKQLRLVSDWDDVCMLIALKVMFELRREVRKELGYMTLGGVARNKRLAKLAGGLIKPDMQTVVRNSLIPVFLANFELTDITGMGGKTGDLVLAQFDVPPDQNSIAYLRENFSLEDLRKELHDEGLSSRVYEMVRGNHQEPFKPRISVKSMMSRKNFMPDAPVETLFDAMDWAKVFIGDLYGRLIELDDENLSLLLSQEDRREKGYIMRPKTLSVQITTLSYSHISRQLPLPISRDLEKLKELMWATTFRVLVELLEQTTVSTLNPNVKLRSLKVSDTEALKKYKIMLLANLCIVISNFVTTTDSHLIDLYANSTAQDMKKLFEEVNQPKPEPPKKEKKGMDRSYVDLLFQDFERNKVAAPEPKPKPAFKEDREYVNKLFAEFESLKSPEPKPEPKHEKEKENPLLASLIKHRHCHECNIPVEDVFEHADFHYAKQLSERLNTTPLPKKRRTQTRLPF